MRASVLHVDSHVDPPYAPTHTHVQFEPSCCSLSPPGRMHLGGFKASILLDKPMLEDAPQYTSPSTRTFCVLKTTSESSPVLSTYTSPSSFATVTRFSVRSCATGCAVRRKAKNAVSRLGSGGRGGERDRSFDRRRCRHAPNVVRARRPLLRRKSSRTRGSIAPCAAFDAPGVDGVDGQRSRGTDERCCLGFSARSTSTRKKRAERDRWASNA